jgi:PPE-repeat protein
VLDFGGLPPEINSARMYAGPGPGSMLTSASAWDGLASELRSTALSYGTVTSELTDSTWQGPSSAAMEEAVTPYVAWLNSAAAEAEQTATQARAAASAYQTAFTAMVPPETIAANRIQLAMLNATNTFGQNTPAIATTEAQYGEMWAQDAAAMYGYAGNSAAASRVTPFTAPPATTNPAGAANQTAATAQAVGTSSGAGVQSALSQLVSNVPASLQSLASPAASTTPTSLSTLLTNFLNSLGSTSSTAATTGIPGLDSSTIIGDVENYVGLFGLFMGLDAMGPLMGTPISNAITQAMAPVAAAAAPAMTAGGAAAAMGGAAGGFAGGASGFAGGASGFAGLGTAASVGVLSVPPSWGTAATPTWLATMPLGSALTGVGSTQGGMPFGLPVMPGGMGQAAGVAAAAGVGGAVASRYGPRLKVLTRSPGAGYTQAPMAPAGTYGVPPGVPPAPGYTPHIVYLPNNGQNGQNGHNGYNGNGYNGNGYNGNGHNGNGHGPN